MVKFAHLADCHVGGWREPVMRELNHQAFCVAIDSCISEVVDFVIIAGDLFHTAFPAVESLALVTRKLKCLKDKSIAVYAIPGSHDFSASGACMLDVLEEAGLLTQVCRGELVENKLRLSFVTDPKTNIKLTGLVGKKGALDKEYYALLDHASLEQVSGPKIFVFHCAISELKPKELQDMDAMPVSLLPRGFAYYAGGHVHVVEHKSLDNRNNIVFPGPTFPNNFAELEKLGQGSFCIVEDWKLRVVPVKIVPVVAIQINCSGKNPQEIEQCVRECLRAQSVDAVIVLIRVFGVIREGVPSDINWQRVLEGSSARIILRSTAGLSSKEFEEVVLAPQPIEVMEQQLIAQQSSALVWQDKEHDPVLVASVMLCLDIERQDGEKVVDFENKIIKIMERLMKNSSAPAENKK